MKRLLYLLCAACLLAAGCLSDDDDMERRSGDSLVREGHRGEGLPELDAGDVVYQKCSYSDGVMLLREEVIGTLTPEIEERAAFPPNFMGPDEPWIYNDSAWNDMNVAGEYERCYQITRTPNPSYEGD